MKKQNEYSILFLIFGLLLLSGCQPMHLEIPITTITDKSEEEHTEVYESETHDLVEKMVEAVHEEGTEESEEEPIQTNIGSFEVIDDVRICKNINFDIGNKLVNVYDVNDNSLNESSVAVDRTQKEECVLKYKIKDKDFDVWVYINANGENRLKPWETDVVTENLMSVYSPVIDNISGLGYSGNYKQLVETNTLESGDVIYKVYNDTYISKNINNVLLSFHLSCVKSFDENSFSELGNNRIITDNDINNVLKAFTFVDSKEIEVIEKQFNFVNTISFSDKVVNSNLVFDFPFNVNEKVVSGGETVNSVEVPDRPGLILRVKNNDVISKSVKQCNILSLTYEFYESNEYDCLLFDYLSPNSDLSVVDKNILNYDNYYVDSNGTGYVVYNVEKDCIRTVTTYYVSNRLTGIVVDFY